jgi:adrenodoxin-NADP+ reductase
LQVSFTIKELRELTKLQGVRARLKPDDYDLIEPSIVEKLERPRKRLTELLLKTVETSESTFPPMVRTLSSSCFPRSVHVKDGTERFWYLQFWERPKQINGKKTVESVDFEQTEPVPTSHFADENLAVRGNGIVESIPCGLVIKSIGYSGIQVSIQWVLFHGPMTGCSRSIPGCRSTKNVV